MAVIQLFDPLFIGIQLFPLHTDPMQIEIDLKKKTSYPAVGVVKRMDLNKLLIKFDGVIHRLFCPGNKMGDRMFNFCADSFG